MDDIESDRLLRINQVIEIVSLSQAMIYRLVKAGRFPRPCKPGGVSSRWSEREIQAWVVAALASREAQS